MGNGRWTCVGALLALAVGCSGSDDGGSDGGPVGPPCGTLGHGTAEEMAATPREHEEMELLAIALSGGVTADPAIYERVVRDLALIRAGNPLAFIRYRPPNDGKSLIVMFEEGDAAADRIEAGSYVPEWDCLNRHYEAEEVQIISGRYRDRALVRFQGRYDLSLVAEDYAALPGVDLAQGNGLLGDGPTICAGIDGDTYQYVFDDASGDCPAGCIDHEYTYYRVSADGSVEVAGMWTGSAGTAGPEWIELCHR